MTLAALFCNIFWYPRDDWSVYLNWVPTICSQCIWYTYITHNWRILNNILILSYLHVRRSLYCVKVGHSTSLVWDRLSVCFGWGWDERDPPPKKKHTQRACPRLVQAWLEDLNFNQWRPQNRRFQCLVYKYLIWYLFSLLIWIGCLNFINPSILLVRLKCC